MSINKKLFVYIKKLIIKFFIINAFIVILFFITSLFNIYYYWQNKTPYKADAIIVLGAAAWGNKPSPIYKSRLKYAVKLFKNNYAKYIIFTGGSPKVGFPTEALIGAKWAIKNDVPQKFIIIENNSRNTIGNIKNTLMITKNYNFNSFIIVSDSYHLARAKLISKILGLKNIQTAPTPYSLFKNFSIKNKIKIITKESIWIVGLYYYKIYTIIYNKIKN